MIRFARAAVLFGALAFSASLAEAQINPFHGGKSTGLRGDDYKRMQEAAERLRARPDLAVGASEFWDNEKTGASGTISVEDTNRAHGRLCHHVNYAATQRDGRHRDAVLNWCKTPSGWKIG